MSRLILACGTSVFHPHKRRRSFCSPECFLCSDTDWQEQRRGGKGKERKGSAEARSAQNPASEHKPLNRIFKKGFFVIWWRRWMTECFFKNVFYGKYSECFLISGRQIPNAASSHSSRKEVAHICVRTDLQTLLTQSKLHFFCFFFFFLAW